jgi:hypothetical protein
MPVDPREAVDDRQQEQLAEQKIADEIVASVEPVQVQPIANGRSGLEPERVTQQAPEKKWQGQNQHR